jgi:hypothetical protein
MLIWCPSTREEWPTQFQRTTKNDRISLLHQDNKYKDINFIARRVDFSWGLLSDLLEKDVIYGWWYSLGGWISWIHRLFAGKFCVSAPCTLWIRYSKVPLPAQFYCRILQILFIKPSQHQKRNLKPRLTHHLKAVHGTFACYLAFILTWLYSKCPSHRPCNYRYWGQANYSSHFINLEDFDVRFSQGRKKWQNYVAEMLKSYCVQVSWSRALVW